MRLFFNPQTPTIEELSLLSIQLASQFLFQFGFKTKKTLRGAAIEWYVKSFCLVIYSSTKTIDSLQVRCN